MAKSTNSGWVDLVLLRIVEHPIQSVPAIVILGRKAKPRGQAIVDRNGRIPVVCHLASLNSNERAIARHPSAAVNHQDARKASLGGGHKDVRLEGAAIPLRIFNTSDNFNGF